MNVDRSHKAFRKEKQRIGLQQFLEITSLHHIFLHNLCSSGCKYPDPMIGASPSFQARITEMAQLEVETIKFEKTKKTRKKASSS